MIEDFSQQLQLHAQFPVQVIGQARPGEFIGKPGAVLFLLCTRCLSRTAEVSLHTDVHALEGGRG